MVIKVLVRLSWSPTVGDDHFNGDRCNDDHANVDELISTMWFISEVNLWHRSLLLYHHLYTYQLYFMASLKYISDIFQLTH